MRSIRLVELRCNTSTYCTSSSGSSRGKNVEKPRPISSTLGNTILPDATSRCVYHERELRLVRWDRWKSSWSATIKFVNLIFLEWDLGYPILRLWRFLPFFSSRAICHQIDLLAVVGCIGIPGPPYFGYHPKFTSSKRLSFPERWFFIENQFYSRNLLVLALFE